jgi:DNA-binding CsgD family transcriptional regulator
MSVSLLDRESEIADIANLLAEAQEGRGGAILLEGPAGIGKTSLLREARQLAERSGMMVFSSQTGRMERDLAWGAVLQLFGGLAWDEALNDHPACLARPLLTQAAAPTSGAEQVPLLHGMHWLVNRLSDRGSLLLMLDDIHHSDGESLTFIAYLLSRIEHLPVAILLATRKGEPVSGEAEMAIAQIRAHDRVALIEPRPLSSAAVRELTQRSLPTDDDALIRSIIAKVGGNPFLCISLANWYRTNRVDQAEGEPLAPVSIQRELISRLESYGPEAVATAQAIAVLGHAKLEQIARIADLNLSDVAGAVDLMVRTDLLEVRSDDFRFSHPIAQEAVYATIGPSRLGRMHRLSAEVMRDLAQPAREVAAHLMLSDVLDESWQISTLAEAAASEVMMGAPAQAAARYRRILSTRLSPDTRARTLFELGKAEIAAGQGGLAHMREAINVLPPSRTDVDLVMRIGESLYAGGRFDEAEQVFAQGLDLLDQAEEKDPRIEARLIAGLRITSLLCGSHVQRAVDATQQAETRFTEGVDSAERTLMALAAGEFALGIARDRVAVISLANRALDGQAPSELGRTVLEPLAASLVYCDEFTAAKRLLGEVIDEASSSGQAVAYASLLAIRSNCHLCAGEIVEAEADARACLRILAEFPAASTQAEPIARYVLARSCQAAGRLDQAVEAAKLDRICSASELTPLHGWLRTAQGHLNLRLGAADKALVCFEEAGRLMAPFSDAGVACDWRSGAALSLRALDRIPEAQKLAHEERELAESFGGRRVMGLAWRRCAEVSSSRAEAIEYLEHSVETLVGSGLLDLAASKVELGAAQRRCGELRRARETLREGLALAQEIDAHGLAARAADELALAGARRPDLELTGAKSLTASQRRVARMAAQGLSNAEIAAALFVTKRTVETHLTATYSKLGIRSRQELQLDML